MGRRFGTVAALAVGLVPSLVLAEEQSAFVEANILGIFYHELGHAIIDVEQVPIFGQEEDAADVFSIFMIDALFEEEAAQELAYEASFGFWGEVVLKEEQDWGTAWWDVHGPDEQRFYNTVCIFYGANPEAREEFAEQLDLPEERADSCPFEYDQAANSWGAVLDGLIDRGAGDSLRFHGDGGTLTDIVLREEIEALNAEMTLSTPINVYVESCGEANAFYDPNAREVVFCSEFEDHLVAMEAKL